MTVTTTIYPQSGIPVRCPPPRPGIYYVAVAIYNQSQVTYQVQLGPGQNTLSPLSASLFPIPSSGKSPILYGSPSSYPFGAYLGPLTAVWFEPDDPPGSFPVPLTPFSGLVQWTPSLVFGSPLGSPPATNNPAVGISPLPTSATVTNLSNGSATVYVYSGPSDAQVGTAVIGALETVTIPLTGAAATDTYLYFGQDNTVFELTASIAAQ